MDKRLKLCELRFKCGHSTRQLCLDDDRSFQNTLAHSLKVPCCYCFETQFKGESSGKIDIITRIYQLGYKPINGGRELKKLISIACCLDISIPSAVDVAFINIVDREIDNYYFDCNGN